MLAFIFVLGAFICPSTAQNEPAVIKAATTTAPTTAPAKFFPNGQKVEVKWGGIWRKAVVINHRGRWVLIDYDGNRFFREWVEPWRVRAIGSADDFSGPAPINPAVHHNEGPPRADPGPAPADVSEQHGAGQRPADADQTADAPLTPVVRQNVRSIPLDRLPALPSLVPDAALPQNWSTAPIDLHGSSGEFFDQPGALLLSPQSGVAAVLHVDAAPGKGPPQCRLERVDLKSGRSLNVASFPLEPELLDLSSDGKLLLARTSPLLPGHGARLDVWRVDGDKSIHVLSFTPFTARSGGEQVVWARFAGADHVLARSFDGELSCHTLRAPTQVWSAKLGPGSANAIALSANGKYLAASTGRSVALLEPLTGKVLGGIDLGGRPSQSLAFNPDGKQIAVAGPDEVTAWDLTISAPPTQMWAVGSPGQIVDWAQDRYLLLDHQRLVSMSRHVTVWSYQGIASSTRGQLAQTWDARLYYIADAASPGQKHRPVIVSVALPDQKVQNAITAASEPPMALKPAMSVTLDVNVDPSIQQRVVDAIIAKLKANGVTVADGLPLRLLVKDEPGQTREVVYRRIGFGALPGQDKTSVQEVRRLIALVGSDGKPLWQRSGVMLPPAFLSLKQGQSIQEAVADAMRPSPQFYESARIPALVPQHAEGLATTFLTASGAGTSSVRSQ